MSIILRNVILLTSILLNISPSLATHTDLEADKGALKLSFLRLCDDDQIEIAQLKETLSDIDRLPMSEASRVTYDALIKIGVYAPAIDSWFQTNGIEIPETSYNAIGSKGIWWNPGFRGSWTANVASIKKNWQRWVLNNGTFLLSSLAIIDFVSSVPAAAASSIYSKCEAPNGSYRQTCDVRSAKEYQSSDPNLSKVPMCKYDIMCRKLDGKSQQQTIYMPQADVQCLKYRENCDGNLIMRSWDQRLCTTEEAIKAQVNQYRKEL